MNLGEENMAGIKDYLKEKKQKKAEAKLRERDEYLQEKGVLLQGKEVDTLLLTLNKFSESQKGRKSSTNSIDKIISGSNLDSVSQAKIHRAFDVACTAKVPSVFIETVNPVDRGIDYKSVGVHYDFYYMQDPIMDPFLMAQVGPPQVIVEDADSHEVEVVRLAQMERESSEAVTGNQDVLDIDSVFREL